MSDDEQEFLGYRLTLTVVGPDHREEVVVTDMDPMKLEPDFVERNGMAFERYVGDDEYEFIEVRFDYIVARRREIITPDPTPLPPAEPMSDEDALDMPAEERVARNRMET